MNELSDELTVILLLLQMYPWCAQPEKTLSWNTRASTPAAAVPFVITFGYNNYTQPKQRFAKCNCYVTPNRRPESVYWKHRWRYYSEVGWLEEIQNSATPTQHQTRIWMKQRLTDKTDWHRRNEGEWQETLSSIDNTHCNICTSVTSTVS